MMRMAFGALLIFAAVATPALADRAVIRGLDKVTGHARDYTMALGRTTRIGDLEVVPRACYKSAPEEAPEVRIYVQVYDHPTAREGEQEQERREIFHGWLFASSPGINAVDHPVYDIWAVDCVQ